MDDSVDLEAIALATSGAVGSDLANMINEAAITAVKRGSQVVSQKDLLEAVEVVLVGKEKKDRVMNQKDVSFPIMRLAMHLSVHFKRIQNLYRKSQLYQEQWVRSAM